MHLYKVAGRRDTTMDGLGQVDHAVQAKREESYLEALTPSAMRSLELRGGFHSHTRSASRNRSVTRSASPSGA